MSLFGRKVRFVGRSRDEVPPSPGSERKEPNLEFQESSIEAVRVARVFEFEICGPKHGPGESAFMSSQREMYERFPAIERAYLVRARHPSEESEVVMLAIAPKSAESLQIVEAIRDDLRRVSGGDPPLDMVFLDSATESAINAVAKPFFDRGDLAA